MQKIFITQKRVKNSFYVSERIYAKSWKEAEEKAKNLSIEIVGVLQD